jgi:glutamate-5-semialdehyde dehydrogenase
MFGMTALKTLELPANIASQMHALGRRAKAAARVLALAPTRQKDDALAATAKEIRARASDILAANAGDLAALDAAKRHGD